MGLEVDLFEEKVPSDLVCGICENVFLDPVANACPHVFCRACIKKRLSRHSTRSCPICKTQLISKSHQPSVDLKRRLLNLVINCSHDCGGRFPLAEFPEHITYDCPNIPTTCPNRAKGCREKVPRCAVEWHLEECEYRLVDCDACSAQVVYRELLVHQKRNRCLEKRLKQHLTQEFRRVNLDVIKHRRQVDRDTLRLEVDQRKRFLDHFRSKQWKQPNRRSPPRTAATTRSEPSRAFFLTETASCETRPQTTGLTQDGVIYNCTKCSKPFRPDNNHNMSCCWHPGVR
ncbi:hypothetical protein SNE40_018551 [Patella caerulea]|uniref:Uncharacterized protein n=1 Tax=Patella caerulea TaxID=87958 RepID=A0AAN8J566_PATCE